MFFAQLFGTLGLFVGITMALQRAHYRKAFKHFYKNDALLFVAGAFIFALGLVIVLLHHEWDTPLEVIISLLGWGAVLEGAAYLAFPDQMYSLFKKYINRNFYYVSVVSSLLVGAYLTMQGFFA